MIEFPYHLHIDALSLPKALENYVKGVLGFADADFSGHPEGYAHFEPNRHLTLKFREKSEFVQTWEVLKDKSTQLGLVGYLEGELISYDLIIPANKYREEVPLPFSIPRRRLVGPPTESFRDAEIHLVLDKDNSDPRLIKKLLDAGLYGAYLRKKDYDALVLTIQGSGKTVDLVYGSVFDYLTDAGGSINCTLQKEVAIAHHLVGITHKDLPEIGDRVEFVDKEMREKAERMISFLKPFERFERKGRDLANGLRRYSKAIRDAQTKSGT